MIIDGFLFMDEETITSSDYSTHVQTIYLLSAMLGILNCILQTHWHVMMKLRAPWLT